VNELGRVGVWASARTVDDLPAAARAVEAMGYGTFWLGGSPPERALRHLLGATGSIVCATGILNVWQHDPADVAREHAELTANHPGRVMLGIGIGHPEATSDYARPLKTMRDFFAGLDGVPHDERCAAALGPKMLELAAAQSRGTHPYFVPAEHTAFARATVGPDALVAPEVACVVDEDAQSGRAKAREYAALYLQLSNYTNNLLRFGFTEADIADGGSDRLIDAVVPHGSAAHIAQAVEQHLAAGADHVCLQPVGGDPLSDWAALAEALGA
jgi:probable F420-dependent oxidoreductase